MARQPSCLCGTCKPCKQRVKSREWYQKNPAKAREHARLSRLRRLEQVRAHDRTRSQRERDPVKARARWAVHHAIFAGRIARLPCEKCGETKVDAHHDDYSKPLDVRWLCRPHHAELHRIYGIAEAA